MKLTAIVLSLLCIPLIGCKKVYNKKMSIEIVNPVTQEGLASLEVQAGIINKTNSTQYKTTNANGYAEFNLENKDESASFLYVNGQDLEDLIFAGGDTTAYAFDKNFTSKQYYSTVYQPEKHIKVQFLKSRRYRLVILPNTPTDTMDASDGIFIHEFQDDFFNVYNGFSFRRIPFFPTEDGFTEFVIDQQGSVFIGKNTLRLHVLYKNGQEIDITHEFELTADRPGSLIDTLYLP